MPILSAGAHADVVLAVGEVLRVSTAGVATVAASYGAPAGTTTVTANTQDFGPYSVPAKLALTAVSGSSNYSMPGQFPVTYDPSTGVFNPPISPEVTVQPIRTGSSVAAQSDAGTIIPVSGAASYRIDAGLIGFSAQLLRHDAGTLTVQSGAGVTLFHGGVSISSLSVTLKGQWILLMPGAAANEFYLTRYVGG
ncbi:hypothetical protein [Pseudorhodoferax sp. Leaf265]|uniref:hypothetical protein n=1 Tax=Pseudorhodoferax sp. Leaf265 TaxID=1736315 RepID=UPI0006FFAC16|nr:hypothetical protein [Pseudorhodoferax sp. Leaf265]KQP02461.1 hypothetical protein ASF45_20620 [Pseudorhodoferax sp. Leaf265]